MMSWSDGFQKLCEWYWGAEKPTKDVIEDNWEFLQGEVPLETVAVEVKEEEQSFHQPEPRTTVGFYSLLTTDLIRRFLYENRETISCYWPEDENHGSRGSLKVFRSSAVPPGWFKLSDLTRRSAISFQQPWSEIIRNELGRLRSLELRDPYSISTAFTSGIFQGLFLYLPFHVFVWKDIAANPYADLNISLPLERLYDKSQVAHPWREVADSIVTDLATRPPSFPPIVVHLIGPRITILRSEAERAALHSEAVACKEEYPKWFDISFLQV